MTKLLSMHKGERESKKISMEAQGSSLISRAKRRKISKSQLQFENFQQHEHTIDFH